MYNSTLLFTIYMLNMIRDISHMWYLKTCIFIVKKSDLCGQSTVLSKRPIKWTH